MMRLRAVLDSINRAVGQHPWRIVTVIIMVLAGVALLVPQPLTQAVLSPRDEDARIGIDSTHTIGQSFISLPGLRSVTVPLVVETEATVPTLLHVRREFYGEDIRVSPLFLGAGEQEAHFSFEPLEEEDETLLWILETPHTSPPAVFAYREVADGLFESGEAYVNGKNIPGNFGFTLIGSLRTDRALIRAIKDTYQAAAEWEVHALLFGITMAAMVMAGQRFGIILRQQSMYRLYVLAAIILLGFMAHVYLAHQLPLVNDEGAYLQDAWQMQPDFLPVADYSTKGPLYIVGLKIWQALVPHTVVALRLFSALMWSLAVIFLVGLARQLGFSAGQQIVTAAILALSPAAVSLSTPLLLQIASTTVSLAALAAVARGAKNNNTRFVIVGALLMAAAYFVRASSGVTAIVGALLIYFLGGASKRNLMIYIGTGAGVAAIVAVLGALVMGWDKTLVLFNLEAFHVAQQRQIVADSGASEPLLRELIAYTPVLFRSAPWLLAALLSLPAVFMSRRPLPRLVLASLWLAILGMAARHVVDMDYLLPGSFPIVRSALMLLVFGMPLIMGAIFMYRPADKSVPVADRRMLLILVGWLVLLTALYHLWARWRHSYLVEFLPPLVLITSWITVLALRRLPRNILAATAFLVGFCFWAGWYNVVHYAHTGTLEQESVRTMVAAVEQHVPVNEAIFTAQPVITSLARRPIVLGYSHPGWYRDEYLGKLSTALRSLYFVDPAALTEYLGNDANFVLMDRRTHEVYFEFHPERQDILRSEFELIATVDNPLEDPFQLYRRR